MLVLVVVVVVLAFFSLAKIFGECSTIHSTPALFFFLKWRLGFAHYFHSSCQDQSTVAQQAETIPGQRHSQSTLTLLDQGCMCL